MLSRETYLVSIGDEVAMPIISRAWLVMTSKADKFPLETEPVTRDNNTHVKTWTGLFKARLS